MTDPLSRLRDRFDTSQALHDLIEGVGAITRLDRIGAAIYEQEDDTLDVVGIADRSEAADTTPYAFPARRTVGEWVMHTRIPFIGARQSDLTRFDATLASMARDDYRSNCVLPMDLDGSQGVLFLLARREAAFDAMTLGICARIRDVIEPVVRAHVATQQLRDGERARPEKRETHNADAASLADVERIHIESTLRETNWVIEGPRGAAIRLGLKPSTLRHRLRKLGIRRNETYSSEARD